MKLDIFPEPTCVIISEMAIEFLRFTKHMSKVELKVSDDGFSFKGSYGTCYCDVGFTKDDHETEWYITP
eukprot:UN17994